MGWETILALALICWLASRVPAINRCIFPRKWEIIEEESVAREIDIINESIEIASRSKRIDTVLSRLDTAITLLGEIIARYPHRKDWIQSRGKLIREKKMQKHEHVERTIKKRMEKAQLAKGIGPKVNNANKAIEELLQFERDGWLPRKNALHAIGVIQKFIFDAEIKALTTKARRYEFKKNWKKAIDGYQDLLFFLQEEGGSQGQIAQVEAKIAALDNLPNKLGE